jgi:hypothetical protein
MAKIRKCKLSWKPSDSNQVVGYRLYWAKGDRVSYNSDFIALDSVSEAYLPDALQDIPLYDQPIMFGITAVDNNGNESDMTTLIEPFLFEVPAAPVELSITVLDEYEVVAVTNKAPDRQKEIAPKTTLSKHQKRQQSRIKYYDDLGYRELTVD